MELNLPKIGLAISRTRLIRLKRCRLIALLIGLAQADGTSHAQNAPPPMKPNSVAATGAAAGASLNAKPERNVTGIMDNSFLVEEAYNQEAGVVQHIFSSIYGVNRLRGSDDRSWDFSFTQEWPVFGQAHQFSYTVPYSVLESGGQTSHGVGDVLLNYRYQAYYAEESLRAFAPRFSFVLPTGDADRGFGDNSVGFQWNLPFSTAVGDNWFAHANAGLTLLPDAGPSPRHNLLHFNLGASAIYAVSPTLHLMVEWVGLWNERGDSISRSRRELETVISPGVRRAFNFSNGAQLVLGLAAPIGLSGPAPDFGALVYVSFEHDLKRRK